MEENDGVSGEKGEIFTASTQNPLFTNAKTYVITVVGVIDDIAYGTSFKLVVEP